MSTKCERCEQLERELKLIRRGDSLAIEEIRSLRAANQDLKNECVSERQKRDGLEARLLEIHRACGEATEGKAPSPIDGFRLMQSELAALRKAINGVINSAVDPANAKFASMVPLEPLRAAIRAAMKGGKE